MSLICSAEVVCTAAAIASKETISPSEGAPSDCLKQPPAGLKVQKQQSTEQKTTLSGLNIAVWAPAAIPVGGAPLIIFSHGFHGYNSQTRFLMRAFAEAGYLVIAPNHRDALGEAGIFSKPEIRFSKYASWTDQTHKDRAEDIVKLIDALHRDQNWNSRIDWSKLALAGHSLGGYTVLGLAGGWPSWKIPGVKAVLALSPYCHPFAKQHTLRFVDAPVMYQSGTHDMPMAIFIGGQDGAFHQTPSSATSYVVFDRANHFAFSDLNPSRKQRQLITHYSLAFLNKYVMNDQSADLHQKLAGVKKLETKS